MLFFHSLFNKVDVPDDHQQDANKVPIFIENQRNLYIVDKILDKYPDMKFCVSFQSRVVIMIFIVPSGLLWGPLKLIDNVWYVGMEKKSFDQLQQKKNAIASSGTRTRLIRVAGEYFPPKPTTLSND